jgi:hypothetical protein
VPQPQRRLQVIACRFGIAARELDTRPPQQVLEPMGVDRVLLDVELVADRAMPDRHLRSEALAQPRDLLLQRLDTVAGRLIRPHRLDELVDRHGLARVKRQRSEQRSLLGTLELDNVRPYPNDERAKELDIDRRAHSPSHEG